MKKVNLKEVAERAGVSMMSVSRAINDKPGLNTKTREKILSIVKEMGYVPNLLAGSLGRKGTKTIGVVIPVIENTNFPDMLRGIEETLSDQGYRFMLCCSYDDPEKERNEIASMLEMQVDGLIWCPATLEDKFDIMNLIEGQSCPMVFMDRLIPGVDANSVIIDDFEGAYDAVRHFFDQGYSSVAHISSDLECWTSQERLRGYRAGLREFFPNQNEIVEVAEASVEGGAKAMEKLLGQGARAEAVLAFNDPMAIGAAGVLKSEDVNMPNDMGLVGFANTLAAKIMEVPLSSVDQNAHMIGVESARLLVDHIKNEVTSHSIRHVLQSKLYTRESSCAKTC